MPSEYSYEKIAEQGLYDDVGTVRVCAKFGAIAVYIKVEEDCWYTVYVDPVRHTFLVPKRTVSDVVACSHPVAFAPKSVE